MDNQPSSSCECDELEHKGQHQSEDIGELERHNTPSAAEETKSLTNIYYDCLERIFDFLDLESLLNVAGTCKRLQIAAAAKYADDLGHVEVSLHPSQSPSRIFEFKSYNCRIIYVYGMKMCLPFLRCFGAKISNLFVSPSGGYLAYYEHVNRYCADKLTTMFFEYEQICLHEAFFKPFKSITTAEIRTTNLNNQLPNLVHWFPNMRDLFIYDITKDIHCQTAVFAVSIPQLEKLRVSGFCRLHPDGIENLAEFLHANRQLKTLDLRLGRSIMFSTFMDMISEHKSLTQLTFYGRLVYRNVSELNRLADDHPQIEELMLQDCTLDEDRAITLTRRLKSLKQFEFQFKKQGHADESDHFLRNFDKKWQYRVTREDFAFIRIVLFN